MQPGLEILSPKLSAFVDIPHEALVGSIAKRVVSENVIWCRRACSGTHELL